jgi:hypothetical protein
MILGLHEQQHPEHIQTHDAGHAIPNKTITQTNSSSPECTEQQNYQ